MNVLAADTPTDLMPSDIESPLRLRRRRQAATVPRGWQSVASLDGAERSVLGARLDEAHHASAAGALAPPALSAWSRSTRSSALSTPSVATASCSAARSRSRAQ